MRHNWKQLAAAFGEGLGLTLALLWLIGIAQPSQADSPTLYVGLGGSCGGAIPCYATVQAAVDAASPGDEIWVAAGTYTGVHARRAPLSYHGPDTITQVVYVSKTVTIRGGYGPSFSGPPDPEANPTVLDAEGMGRVLFIGDDITPTIEGLHLTSGDATGLAGDHWDYDAGGGVFLWHSEAPATISGCHVFSNTARYGGAFYLYEGAPTLRANTISSNTGGACGGGLFLYSSQPTLTANAIIHNATGSSSGGGLFIYHGYATLNGNTIRFNNAASGGGGLCVQGGRSTFNNNVIADNEGSPGGGIFMLACSPRLFHTTFARNRSWQGSGIHVVGGYGSTPALTNTILYSHTQAIYVGEGNTATLNATLWHDNGTDFTGNLIHLNDLSGDPDFGPDGYRLGANSAAIDAGVDAGVTTDIDANRRPIGAGYDLGADERLLASYLPLVVRGYQP